MSAKKTVSTEVATKEVKKVATKEEVKPAEEKKEEVKKVATKEEVKNAEKKEEVKNAEKKEEVKNAEKKDTMLNIQQVTELYAELGIKCYNPLAKGNYRIMGSKKGSSLNLTKKDVKIYSTEDDTTLIKEAVLNGLKGVEVIDGGNSQDTTRPNIIRCTTVEALKALLKVYATNVFNQVVSETAAAVKEA